MKKSQIIRYLANEVYSNHPFEIEMCEYYHSKGVFFREMKWIQTFYFKMEIIEYMSTLGR